MNAHESLRCRDVAPLLVFYVCDEISEQERRQVEAHLAACEACAAQLAEERVLHATLAEALQPADELDRAGILLSRCRSELAEALDDLANPPMQEHWRPFGWLRRWMALRPAWSGALLVLFGLVLGTQLMPWFSTPTNSAHAGHTVNVSPSPRFSDDQLAKMAVAGINLAPVPDAAPGTLQVQVRTEQPLVLSGSVDDPDLRRVLTYVVENGDQTDPGVRSDCLEALRTRTSDQEVRQALLIAARRDQNPAIRMKAIESLRDFVADKSVREALIDALERDPNPGVRVEAVNLLVRSLETPTSTGMNGPMEPPVRPAAPGGDPSVERLLRTLQQLERSDPNRYVRLRSAAALKQIGPREVQ